MKKKELGYISLLSILLFVSFANVSVAAPPSYVGVKNGDELVWTASLNMANINATGIALIPDNWTYIYEYFLEYFENNTGMEFDGFVGAGMKAVMKNVTDEMPHPFYTGFSGSGLYFDFYVAYAANNWTLLTEAANMTSPMLFLIDPSGLNESTITYGLSGMPLVMSIGYNYALFAETYQTMIEATPALNGNVSVQVHGNGFKITLKALYLELMFDQLGVPFEIGTLSDAVLTFRWNSNGVFDYGSIAYGGLTLVTAQLVVPDDMIPGYEIVTFIGVSIVTLLAIIYIKRKKNL
ncbi:MAG: hypothetical protein ACTSRT_17450 [Promethearchaeota archaeon]